MFRASRKYDVDIPFWRPPFSSLYLSTFYFHFQASIIFSTFLRTSNFHSVLKLHLSFQSLGSVLTLEVTC